MASLLEEIACNQAQFAVEAWGKHLPKGKQVTLYKRYYDSVMSALLTFKEVDESRRVRARAMVSEN